MAIFHQATDASPSEMTKFLNKYEAVTYSKIRAIAEKVGAHVFAKVRLADALPIHNSGISGEAFTYALKSHVDFLVTNSEHEPQFCVEFDGPAHNEPKQMRRDEIKNSLFERFDMAYLRVNARYLDDCYRGLDLLTYFVDVWFLSLAFHEAQSSGQVPQDEPFDPASIYSNESDKSWPYRLSLNLEKKIQRFFHDGRIAQWTPSHWIGEDKQGKLRCIAWLFVTDERCAFIETGMREHRFPAVDCCDVLAQLAVYDLYKSLVLGLTGRKKLSPAIELAKRLNFYRTHYDAHSVATCGTR